MIQSAPRVSEPLNARVRPSGDQLAKNPQPSRSTGFCQAPLAARRTVQMPPRPPKIE